MGGRSFHPCDWYAEKVLVDGGCEMRLDEEAIVGSLSPHAAHKLEVVQVVRLMLGCAMDVVPMVFRERYKHCVLWIHNLPGNEHEPCPREPPIVPPLLLHDIESAPTNAGMQSHPFMSVRGTNGAWRQADLFEFYLEGTAKLVPAEARKRAERVVEEVVAVHLDLDRLDAGNLLVKLAQFSVEPR